MFDEVTLPVNITALRNYGVNVQTLVEDIQTRTALRVPSSGDRLMISGTFSSIQTARNMVLRHIVLASRRQMVSAADLVSEYSGELLVILLLILLRLFNNVLKGKISASSITSINTILIIKL